MNAKSRIIPEDRYRALVDLCPDPAAVIQKGRFRLASSPFLALIGYNRRDMRRGLAVKDVLAEPDCDSARELVGAGPTARWVRRLDLAAKDKRLIPCEVSAGRVVFEGSPAVLITVRVASDLSRMDRTIQADASKYRELFADVLEGIYQTTPNGRILTANPALVAMLGYDSEQQLCQSARAQDLYADPVERARLLSLLEREGVLRNVEYDLIRRDGSTLTVLENSRAVKDEKGKIAYYEGILIDITERRAAELRLREIHEQLAATLDALPDMLFETDRDARIVDFRAPEPRYLYAEPEAFLGKKVTDVLPKEACDVILRAISHASRHRTSSGGIYSLDFDEGRRWFELSVAVKGDPDDPACRFIGLVHDITELKQTEAELRRTARELEAEKQTLREKNIALHEVLDHLEEKTSSLMAKAYASVEAVVRPLVKKLFDELPPEYSKKRREIEQSLNAIFLNDADDFQRRFAGLSARQSEVCREIASGLSSKEIALKLSTSPATVNKHREMVRKKLGLSGKNISLSSYLRSHLRGRRSHEEI